MGELKTGRINLGSLQGENKTEQIQSCVQYVEAACVITLNFSLKFKCHIDNPSDVKLPIDHFQDIPMDSQTMDITHIVIFHKALETLQSTATYLLGHNEKQQQSWWCP